MQSKVKLSEKTPNNMYSKFVFAILPLLFMSNLCYPSHTYNEVLEVTIEYDSLILTHVHDWSDSTNELRGKILSESGNHFDKRNDYSRLYLVNKFTLDTLFNIPVPALTDLHFANDTVIIGFSDLKISNPHQLIVVGISGHIHYSRNFSSVEVKLDQKDFKYFKQNYNSVYQMLDELDRIYESSDYYYLDISNLYHIDAYNWSEELKTFYNDHLCNNHLAIKVKEAVSNYIFFYDKENLYGRVDFHNNHLIRVELKDPEGDIFTISL